MLVRLARARDDRAEDVGPGGYRTLDVNAPPHDVDGLKVLTYFDGFHMHQRVHVERDPKHKILQGPKISASASVDVSTHSSS